jgi:hypothetical protein
MKNIIATALCLCLITAGAFAQPQCAGMKIETAAVPKPADLTMTLKNCNEAILSWTGSPDQTYIISVTYTGDNMKTLTAEVTNASIICDKNFNCSAVIPLRQDTWLNWSIQAVGTADSRKFYSYPVRGESAGCNGRDIVVTNKTNSEVKPGMNAAVPLIKPELLVYPNPVTGDLTIKWSSMYKGNARLHIMDASGKTVRSFDINKQLPDHLDRITVSALTSGLYFMQVRMQDGNILSSRFVKK